MRAIAANLGLVLAIGTAAAHAAAISESGVTYVSSGKLLSGIVHAPAQDRGIALKTYLSAPDYSATLIRRTRAGSAEVHRNISDVWYVIDGGGTLVTNGSLVGSSETEPGELRGEKIAGGTSRRIAKGDLIAVPAGVPHWVSAVEGAQLVYLVVKVKTPARRR